MKKVLLNSLSILVIFLGASTARADLRIKQRSTTGGQTSETVIATKGTRQRFEIDTGGGTRIVNLTQCDLKRRLTINDALKRYMITPLTADGGGGVMGTAPDMPPPPPLSGTPQPERRGGVVTYTETLTDTGERKQMFGFQARRIKTATQITSDADACSPINRREETDGWYIDLAFNYGCETGATAATAAPAAAPRTGCQDRIQRKQIGTAKLGYPLSVTRTVFSADGQVESQSTTEVVELSRAALEQSLFEVPAGYTEATSFQEMYATSMGEGTGGAESTGGAPNTSDNPSASSAMVAAKRPGVIRVGVVQIINRAERDVSTGPLQTQLTSAINSANVEAVALTATAPAAIEAEARQKACDFILYTDITNLKTSTAKKLGGMFGRATGIGSGGLDKTEARVEFRLMAIDNNATPQLQSSATGKEVGDEPSVGAALKKEAQMVAAEAGKKK